MTELVLSPSSKPHLILADIENSNDIGQEGNPQDIRRGITIRDADPAPPLARVGVLFPHVLAEEILRLDVEDGGPDLHAESGDGRVASCVEETRAGHVFRRGVEGGVELVDEGCVFRGLNSCRRTAK